MNKDRKEHLLNNVYTGKRQHHAVISSKKLFLVLILSALVLFVALSAVMLKIKPQEQEISQTGVQNTSYEVTGLPDLMDVSADQQPALHDFIQGSIGWHWQRDLRDLYGTFYAVAVHANLNEDDANDSLNVFDKMYVSYYTTAERIVLPPLGNRCQMWQLSEQEQKAVKISIKNMLKTQNVYVDGDWTIALISQFDGGNDQGYGALDNNGRWAGINMSNFDNMYLVGKLQSDVNNGFGWPTEYLRVKWVAENSKEQSDGVDASGEFWDRWRYQEEFKLKSTGNTQNVDGKFKTENEINVRVIRENRFQLDQDGQLSDMTEQAMLDFCKIAGYAVDDGGNK